MADMAGVAGALTWLTLPELTWLHPPKLRICQQRGGVARQLRRRRPRGAVGCHARRAHAHDRGRRSDGERKRVAVHTHREHHLHGAAGAERWGADMWALRKAASEMRAGRGGREDAGANRG
eukprot:363572-Chlamydomonas_euryale.AAC.3